MKLEPSEIVATCTKHYSVWKDEALKAKTSEDMKKYLEKAFFWLELQNNLLVLWTIEKTMGKDEMIKERIEQAHLNINKKIVDYASNVLKDLE